MVSALTQSSLAQNQDSKYVETLDGGIWADTKTAEASQWAPLRDNMGSIKEITGTNIQFVSVPPVSRIPSDTNRTTSG